MKTGHMEKAPSHPGQDQINLQRRRALFQPRHTPTHEHLTFTHSCVRYLLSDASCERPTHLATLADPFPLGVRVGVRGGEKRRREGEEVEKGEKQEEEGTPGCQRSQQAFLGPRCRSLSSASWCIQHSPMYACFSWTFIHSAHFTVKQIWFGQ